MARMFLDNMGYMNRVNVRDVPLDLPEAELERYKKVFHTFDADNSGI